MAQTSRPQRPAVGRRAARAALVSGVLAVLLLATLVALAAQSTDPEPSRFGVAPERPGDRWVYNVSHFASGTNGTEPVLDPWIQTQIVRAATTTVNEPSGGVLPALALTETRHYQDTEDGPNWTRILEHRVDPETGLGRETAVSRFEGVGSATVTGELPGGDPFGTGEQEYRIVNSTRLAVDGAPCGHTNDLQGAPTSTSETIQVAGECLPDGAARLYSFRHLGTTQLPEGTAHVYGLDADPQHVQLWFHHDTPVPVQVAVRLDDGDVHRILRLVHFERGEPPAALWPGAEPVPRPETAPSGPLGPDASGIEHPFPLADADAAARADATLSGWLASARAVLVEASYLERVARAQADRFAEAPYPGIERVWTLTYATPDEARRVEAVRAESQSTDGSPTPIPTLPAPLRDTVQPIEIRAATAPEGPFPADEDLPQTLPTTSSLLDAWRALGGVQQDPAWALSYGFAYTCGDAACLDVRGAAWAGDARTITPAGFTAAGVIATEIQVSFVRGAADGRLLGTDTVEHKQVTYTETPLFVIGEAQQPTNGPGLFSGGAAPVPWSGPFLVPAVAATLIALLVGILYYLWPATKNWLGAALFHRDATDLLANPVRAEIFHAVTGQPGIHHKELMRRVGHGNHVVRHHLGQLQRGRLVAVSRGPGYVCYFPAGRTDRRLMAAAPVLKSDVARRMLDVVRAEPGQSATALAETLGIAPATVSYHLKRLAEAGLVVLERQGRTVKVGPTQLAADAASAA